MRLAAQTIREYARLHHMITPFHEERFVVRGKSGGLSSASYDMTIGHDLTLGVNPSYIIERHISGGYNMAEQGDLEKLRYDLTCNPPCAALAHTTEDLRMPTFIDAQVTDKSSYARVFCSAFNTYVDPGFRGNLTLELVNHGREPMVIKAGDPIVQLLFTLLDRATDRPYKGKYQDQTKGAHPTRYEVASNPSAPNTYGQYIGLMRDQHDFTPRPSDPIGVTCRHCGVHVNHTKSQEPCKGEQDR